MIIALLCMIFGFGEDDTTNSVNILIDIIQLLI